MQNQLTLQRNQTQPMRHDLILNDRSVVVDVHLLDGHRRHLADHDPTKRVGKGRRHADHVKFQLIFLRRLDFYLQTLLELFNGEYFVGKAIVECGLFDFVLVEQDARSLVGFGAWHRCKFT